MATKEIVYGYIYLLLDNGDTVEIKFDETDFDEVQAKVDEAMKHNLLLWIDDDTMEAILCGQNVRQLNMARVVAEIY